MPSKPRYPRTLAGAMKARKLSQRALARLVGVTQPSVQQWTSGATVPAGPSRRMLAQALVVPLDVVNEWFQRRRISP